MNQDIAIEVQNLYKVYKLYDAPIDRLKEALDPRKKKYHKDFHALNDISFEVKKGETVGIIGKNGSGKSTLLKIITGVLTPSSGIVQVNGKVSALLELGAGFNLEYTGIENIYFQGNLMGYGIDEMAHKLPYILEFANIGDFINQPVKMYSSGMFARLAFAVAINVSPEILIVDEALSVGDMAFQAKCMAKMKSMMENGTTVLFVSHDTHSVKTLCSKAVYLRNGCMKGFGTVAKVVDMYIEAQHTEMTANLEEFEVESYKDKIDHSVLTDEIPIMVSSLTPKELDFSIAQRYGDAKGTIINAVILDLNYKSVSELISGNEYYVQILVRFNSDLPTFACGFSLSSLDGVQQLTWINSQDGVVFPAVKSGDIYCITTKILVPIKAGVYNLNIGLELPVVFNQQHQFLDVIRNYDTISVKFKDAASGFSAMFKVSGEYFITKCNNKS